MNDFDIIDIFFTKKEPRHINVNKLKNIDKNVKEYLDNRYKDSDSLKETLNRIYYNIDIRPVCNICGAKVKYLSKVNFSKHCSHKCSAIDKETRNKYVNTCLERYGVTNGGCSNGSLEKIKRTNLYKRRVPYSFQDSKVKQKSKETCKQKYDTEFYIQFNIGKKRYKEYCLSKYGVKYTWQRKDVKEKSANTKLLKYNNSTYVNTYKAKETSIHKYGYDSWTKTKVGRNKLSEQYYNSLIKREQTCVDKYGYKYCMQNPEFRQNITKIMINNGTIGNFISKQESSIYNIIKSKYPDTISQYISDTYPYACDFYIPQLDLYIECNFHWTHGDHPYNKDSKEDNIILEKWKNKNTKYYNNAIQTWTIRDVTKRNMAKKNNLNYIEWFSYNEAVQKINTLFEYNKNDTIL